MNRFLHFSLAVISVLPCACASASHFADTSVLVLRGEGPPSCKEVAMLDEVDGAMSLESCDCEHPQLKKGTEAGLVGRLRLAAVKRRANTIWILRTWSEENWLSHSEACCSVVGFRGIAIAYRCSESELEFERRHESGGGAAPSNHSLQPTRPLRRGSLRSVIPCEVRG